MVFLSAPGAVSQAQAYPLRRHRLALAAEHDLNVEVFQWQDRFENAACTADIIMLQNRRSIPLDRLAVAVIRGLTPSAKIVFVDSHASTYVHETELFTEVEAYVRRNRYRDPGNYQRRYRGGRIFAEYFSDLYGTPANSFWVRSSDPEQLHKLVLGWDIGASAHLEELFRRNLTTTDSTKRPIDICCRVGVPAHRDPWYAKHRLAVVETLSALDHVTVIASMEKVARSTYLDELSNSKIVVSPFGWGEVCWRDFETIACGCLLIKPSMEHLETYPFRYEDGETYVFVRWDLADLEEKCRYYLTHEDARLRIVSNALNAHGKYFRAETYAHKFHEIAAIANGIFQRN